MNGKGNKVGTGIPQKWTLRNFLEAFSWRRMETASYCYFILIVIQYNFKLRNQKQYLIIFRKEPLRTPIQIYWDSIRDVPVWNPRSRFELKIRKWQIRFGIRLSLEHLWSLIVLSIRLPSPVTFQNASSTVQGRGALIWVMEVKKKNKASLQANDSFLLARRSLVSSQKGGIYHSTNFIYSTCHPFRPTSAGQSNIREHFLSLPLIGSISRLKITHRIKKSTISRNSKHKRCIRWWAVNNSSYTNNSFRRMQGCNKSRKYMKYWKQKDLLTPVGV